MPDVFDQLSSGSGYKPTGDVFDSLPDSQPAQAAAPQVAPPLVQNPVHPLLADLPQPHDAAAQADLNAQQFVGKLESVGRQMQADAIPPALRTPEPTISAPANPFLSRLREAVTGPDTALGSIDGNKTSKPLINLQDVLPPSSGPVSNAVSGLAEGVSGFTTPANLAAIPLIGTFGRLGGPVVSRLVSGGFSLQALKGLWDSVPQFKQAVSSGNTDEAWRLAGRATADAGMAAWMARDALRGEGGPNEALAPEQTTPAGSATPASGDVFDGLPDQAAAKSESQPVVDTASSASTEGGRAGTAVPDVFDRLQAQASPKQSGDVFDTIPNTPSPAAPAAPAAQADTGSTTPLSDNQAATMRLGSDTASATDAAHRIVSDLSDESLGVASADGASQRLQQLSDDDLLRVKQAAEDRSNTAASQAVDDELASRYQDDSGINPRRVVFVGDGYQLRGAEDLGTFSTERDAFNAMKAEASGQPFKGPVIDLANSSTEGDLPVENVQPIKQLPAPETATEQPPSGATAEADQPSATAAGDEQRTAPVLGPKPDDGRPPSSAQLNSMLGGFEQPLKQFGKDDVIPRLKDAAAAVASAKDDIQKTFAPATRDFSSSRASAILRNRIAESVRSYDTAQTALAKAKRFFDSQPASQNFDFLDRVETGVRQPDADQQQIADTFRHMLDSRRREIQALGTGKLNQFIENYVPHLWERPDQAADTFRQMLARRPLEGDKGFLKKRSYVTFKDGLNAGLKPVSDNPVTMILLHARQADKYLLAHRTLADLKDQDLAQFVRLGDAAPPGWKRISDPIGSAFSPSDDGGMVLHGHYYVPEGASNIINNYLSPGLRTHGWFRGLIGVENVLNQAQLGISAYHVGMTTLNSGISRVALGLEQAMRGRPITGLKNIASAPIAPIQNLFEGSKLLKAWFKPGSQGGEFGAIADEMMKAGGRAKNDSFFQQRMVDSMVTAWKRGNPIGALARLPIAALEEVAKPVMEWWVPRLKAGMFLDFARSEMEFHNRRMQSGMAESQSYEEMRQSMRDAWNSVDARLGSVVHDNWFWDRMLKDAAMLNVRSLGWNAGTVMELGGGALDLVKQPLNALQGKHVNVKRLSYLIALNTVMPMINAVYQYARTGQTPQDWKDYLAPRNGDTDENGNPQRTYFPTYQRDEYAWMHDPGATLVNKLSPLDNLTGELIRNKDYYGNRIVNADDPWQDKATELAKFAGKEALPFGIRNAMEQSAQGADLATKAGSFIGITPAPRSINQTKAERLAMELAEANMPPGGRTQEQADRSQLQHQLMREINQGKDVRPDARQALVDGKLTPRELVETLKNAKLSPLERSTQHLGAADTLKVYNVATPAEKQVLRPQLIRKVYGASKTMPEIYFQPLLASTRAALQKGVP